MAERTIISNTKEIHFSNPSSFVSFYKNQPKQGVIFDSSYSKMIGLNKIENEYVIPISKTEPKTTTMKNTNNIQVRVIDPNTAIVNQAKENIRNDIEQSKPMATPTSISQRSKKRTSSCEGAPKQKRPRHKRRNTIVGGDIFSLE